MNNNRIPECFVIFATADWDDGYWTNKQHCACALADLGIKVIYVESPGLRTPNLKSSKDISRIFRRLFKGLGCFLFGPVKRRENLYTLSPILIPVSIGGAAVEFINQKLLSYVLHSSLKKLKFTTPVIWTYHPFIISLLEQIHYRTLVYHCVDFLETVPGVDVEKFSNYEKKLLQSADIVFATSPALASHCRRNNKNTHFLSNVVDLEHFSVQPITCEPSDLKNISRPRICYHGVLSDFKVDLDLLHTVAEQWPKLNFVFIGEEREGQESQKIKEMERLSNVFFLGYKKYVELPAYLRHMDVGILPLQKNKYTEGVFPMKLYEYIASGLPVVSTKFGSSIVPQKHISVVSNPAEFASYCEAEAASAPLSIAEIKTIVGSNTWVARTIEMLRLIDNTN